MTYRVEHTCSQCGGPIEFNETDHLIQCHYCGVKSFLAAEKYHFIMPSRQGEAHILAPYLRFRGTEYYCDPKGVGHRIVDFTQLGLPMKSLPGSLGVRPQALKLRFASKEQGRFLKNYLTLPDALARAEKAVRKIRPREIIYRAYIGETISRVYLPLAIHGGKLFDAVSRELIGNLPGAHDIFAPAYDPEANWQPEFIATVCPQCGWNLNGEADSIALSCSGCDTLWEIRGRQLIQVDFKVLSGGDNACLFLPFWKMEPVFAGIEMETYGQFLKITNQPVVIKPEWERRKLFFWTPAFKVRPQVYLRLTKQLTVSQKEFDPQTTLPRKHHPVTMPVAEAIESLKVVLASATCNKKNVLPLLNEISCKVQRFTLVYLPFTIGPHDLIQEDFKININKKVLEYGRYL